MGAKRICGQLGGTGFVNVTRATQDNVCPNNTVACSSETDAENTVCYPKGVNMLTNCPITDIKFVLTSEVESYASAGYRNASFNDTTSIVYSQTANSLPVTSTLVQY